MKRVSWTVLVFSLVLMLAFWGSMMWKRYFFYTESPGIHLIVAGEGGALEAEFRYDPEMNEGFRHREVSVKTYEQHGLPRPSLVSVVLGGFSGEAHRDGDSFSAIFQIPFWLVVLPFVTILLVSVMRCRKKTNADEV